MSAIASGIGGLLAGVGFKLRGHYSRSPLSLNHNSASKAQLVLALDALSASPARTSKNRSQSAVGEPTRLPVPFEAMSSALNYPRSISRDMELDSTPLGGIGFLSSPNLVRALRS
jgi:hypothetical protein